MPWGLPALVALVALLELLICCADAAAAKRPPKGVPVALVGLYECHVMPCHAMPCHAMPCSLQ